jgi:hypothetical protein
MLPDPNAPSGSGRFWSYPQSRTFAELLVDCEEDRTLRAVLVGMLRETDCWRVSSLGVRPGLWSYRESAGHGDPPV